LEFSVVDTPRNAHIVRFVFTPEDQQEFVKKGAKSFARTAQLPGFRPGTVPPDLIRKRFGRDIFLQQLGEATREELKKYSKENGLQLVTPPFIENEPNANEGWTLGASNFEVKYVLGVKPEVTLALGQLPPLPLAEITYSDDDELLAFATKLRYTLSSQRKELTTEEWEALRGTGAEAIEALRTAEVVLGFDFSYRPYDPGTGAPQPDAERKTSKGTLIHLFGSGFSDQTLAKLTGCAYQTGEGLTLADFELDSSDYLLRLLNLHPALLASIDLKVENLYLLSVLVSTPLSSDEEVVEALNDNVKHSFEGTDLDTQGKLLFLLKEIIRRHNTTSRRNMENWMWRDVAFVHRPALHEKVTEHLLIQALEQMDRKERERLDYNAFQSRFVEQLGLNEFKAAMLANYPDIRITDHKDVMKILSERIQELQADLRQRYANGDPEVTELVTQEVARLRKQDEEDALAGKTHEPEAEAGALVEDDEQYVHPDLEADLAAHDAEQPADELPQPQEDMLADLAEGMYQAVEKLDEQRHAQYVEKVTALIAQSVVYQSLDMQSLQNPERMAAAIEESRMARLVLGQYAQIQPIRHSLNGLLVTF
jgi:hypothetical protein